MMKKSKLIAIYFTITLLSVRCVVDSKSFITIIKNNTNGRLLLAFQPHEFMTDSILYNERFDEFEIEVNKFQIIGLPNIKLSSQPDSVKTLVFVFNRDSMDKYQALNKSQGIFKSSFIKKIAIQLNQVREPLDTIFIK